MKAVPFRQKNPQVWIADYDVLFVELLLKKAERGQLDYELALRDQAMVGELHKIPR